MAGTVKSTFLAIVKGDASQAVSEFKKMGEAAEKSTRKAQSSLDQFAGKATKFGGAAAAAAGAGLILLGKAAGSFEALGVEAGKFSDATGLAVEDASRWIEVAGDMGIEAGAVESALGKLNKNIDPEKFKKLGIEIAHTKDGLTDVNGTFLNAIDRLNEIKDPTDRAKLAAQLFGKGWQSMADLIARGTPALKDALASVSDQKVINEDERKRAEDFRDALDALRDSGEDLALAIGKSAAPVLAGFARTAAAGVEWIVKLDDATGGLAGSFATIGAAAVGAIGAVSAITGQVVKMRSRFIDAETGALKMGGKIAVGFGIATAAAGAAALIYRALDEDKQRVKKTTDDYAAALRAEAAGQKNATREAQVATITGDKFLKLHEDFGLSASDLAKVLNGEQVPAFDKLKATYKANQRELVGNEIKTRELVALYGDSGRVIDNFIARVDEVRGAQKDATAQVAAEKAARADLNAATEANTASLSQWSSDLRLAKQAEEDFGKSLHTSTEYRIAAASAETALYMAMQKTNAAMYDAITTSNDFEKASIDLAATVRDLRAQQTATDKVMKDSKATADEKAAALEALRLKQIDAGESALDTARKWAEERNAGGGALNGYALQRDELVKLKAQFPELATEIQKYIDKLNAIPGVVTTKALVYLPNGDQLGGSLAKPGQVVRKAAGGPLGAGQVAWVGDRFGINHPAAELFVPDRSGTVYNQAQLRNLRSGGGVSIGKIEVHANSADGGRQAAQAFAEEISRLYRQGMRYPWMAAA